MITSRLTEFWKNTHGGNIRFRSLSVFSFSSSNSAVLCCTRFSRLSAYFSSLWSMLSTMSTFLRNKIIFCYSNSQCVYGEWLAHYIDHKLGLTDMVTFELSHKPRVRILRLITPKPNDSSIWNGFSADESGINLLSKEKLSDRNLLDIIYGDDWVNNSLMLIIDEKLNALHHRCPVVPFMEDVHKMVYQRELLQALQHDIPEINHVEFLPQAVNWTSWISTNVYKHQVIQCCLQFFLPL